MKKPASRLSPIYSRKKLRKKRISYVAKQDKLGHFDLDGTSYDCYLGVVVASDKTKTAKSNRAS
jgi:hypothetical protein